jgi:hypothetical protein
VNPRRARLATAALALAFAACLLGAAPALANGWWRISSRVAPTHLAPGSTGILNVAVEDLGDSGVSGASTAITIADVLPAGLKIADPEAVNPHRASKFRDAVEKATEWACTLPSEREASCSTHMSLRPYEGLVLEIPVIAESSLPDETLVSNHASVQGGDTEGTNTPVPAVSLTRAAQIGAQPVTFGLEPGGLLLLPEEEGGTIDTSAGTHPFQLTSTVLFNQTLEEVQEPGHEQILAPAAPALPKDLSFQLPPELLGDVTAAARCSDAQFAVFEVNGNKCPAQSAVGVASVTLLEPSRLGFVTLDVPLFNLEPAQGEPARFGFEADGVPVTLETAVRTESDYGVTVTVNDATEAAQVLGAQITFWGDPSSPTHDNSRGWTCLDGKACPSPSERSNTALLTLPTSCTGPLYSTMEGLAWNGEPIGARFAFQSETGQPLAELEHCPALPFEPSISAQPVEEVESEGQPPAPTTTASAPTGLDVSVKLPQTGTVLAGMPAEADVRSETVALPEGMQLNPSAANGLAVCSEAQIGYQGPGSTDPLSPGAEEPLHFSSQPAACPSAAKLGLVRLRTPLLEEELHGAVYLAEPSLHRHGRARLHHRPLPGGAVRPVDRDSRGRRSVQPGRRGRAFEDRSRPAHRRGHDHQPAAHVRAGHRQTGVRRPARSQRRLRHRRPARLRVQPDQLRPRQRHRQPHWLSRRDGPGLQLLPGRRLPAASLQTRGHRDDHRQDQQSRRRQPRADVQVQDG